MIFHNLEDERIGMKILAVTACPLGMAYTYMAAEMITIACEKAGIESKVETQGSIGIMNEITQEDIASADAVIITTDIPIEKPERFDGIPIVEAEIKTVIKQAGEVIQQAIKIPEE